MRNTFNTFSKKLLHRRNMDVNQPKIKLCVAMNGCEVMTEYCLLMMVK